MTESPRRERFRDDSTLNMEQRDAMNEITEPASLRKYLLGALEDDSVRSRIEEKLMVDEEFAAQIEAAEDELIEEFLDGEMDAADSRRFNTFFLAPPERRRQLRLTRGLRRFSRVEFDRVPQASRSSFSWTFIRSKFSPAQMFAAVGAITILVGLG